MGGQAPLAEAALGRRRRKSASSAILAVKHKESPETQISNYHGSLDMMPTHASGHYAEDAESVGHNWWAHHYQEQHRISACSRSQTGLPVQAGSAPVVPPVKPCEARGGAEPAVQMRRLQGVLAGEDWRLLPTGARDRWQHCRIPHVQKGGAGVSHGPALAALCQKH